MAQNDAPIKGNDRGGTTVPPPSGGADPLPPAGPSVRYPTPVRARVEKPITASLAILAILGVVGLLYYASSVFITVISSILIAIALDPLVKVLNRRARLPRQIASVIVVLVAISALYGLFSFAYGRVEGFVDELPDLMEQIRTAPLVARITEKVEVVTRTVEEAGNRFSQPAPAPKGKTAQPVVVQDGGSWSAAIFRGLGSLTAVAFSLSFIPFLVYFILAEKEPLTARTRELFLPEQRDMVAFILKDIERMMRRFLLGNAIIAAILSVASSVVFLLAGLPDPILLGVLSGTTSIIPYLGLVLAILPPAFAGLVTFESGIPFVAVLASVAALHLVAANFLTPKLVGGGVRLNAVCATLAILFFGWLWGGMGLLLSIPIAAVLKCVLDNIESTRPLGRWMGE